MKQYDYLIVGAGLFGCTFAREARKRGHKCLVIDKRDHVGGNVFTKEMNGINVHWYGAHIFHTNDEGIWKYVNELATFNRYTNSPVALSQGKLYNLPFNMNTFYQMWGVTTPEEAKAKIDEQINDSGIKGEPRNLEEQAISLVGRDIYNTLIKEYTEKQWGRKATDLPAFIIKRLPVRFTFDNNYFNDRYQGIPEGGYNVVVNALLEGIEVRTGVDYFKNRAELDALAEKVVYTGPIDAYYDYEYGTLQYRSLRFEHEVLEGVENYQGNAVVNYNDGSVPYTRIIEHKHFEFGTQKDTVITREYPQEWKLGMEMYYPVNDEANSALFKKYRDRSEAEQGVLVGGRLAEYRYYDMHQIIGSALVAVKKEFAVPA
jgi:UDP-galactopyranose mutase